MAKLIEFKYIYDNKVCTDVSKLLIFIKNILANCKRERLFHYPDGYLLPVRWSREKNRFVIDLGTSLDRDLSGIDIDNASLHFRNKPEYLKILCNLLEKLSCDDLGDYYNIKKNQSKFIAVVFCLRSNEYYNIGLHTFVATNKRKGVYNSSNNKSALLDNSKEFKLNINNFFNIIKSADSYIIKSYSHLYSDFISLLNSKSYNFQLDNRNLNINLQEHIKNNLKFNSSLSHKRNKEIIESKRILEKEKDIVMGSIVKHLISLEFYSFLIENKIIKDYVYYYDDKTKLNYKIKDLKQIDFNNISTEETSYKEHNPYLLLPIKI